MGAGKRHRQHVSRTLSVAGPGEGPRGTDDHRKRIHHGRGHAHAGSGRSILLGHPLSKHVVVIGAGVIGLSVAYACARRGHRVTVLERLPAQRDGCSFGNAGMVVPSHFIPLAAPGMVALGLKWMWNPESPFYIKPRLSWDLAMWALRFWRASTRERVERVAPLLRDLHLASREAFVRLAAEGEEFGLVTKGLLMLCKTQQALDEEGHTTAMARRLGLAADILDARQAAALDPGVTMDIV